MKEGVERKEDLEKVKDEKLRNEVVFISGKIGLVQGHCWAPLH